MQFVDRLKGKTNRRDAIIERNRHAHYVQFLGANGSVIVQEMRSFDSYEEAKEEAQDFVEGHATNVEKIVTLMEYSDAGPLIQAFVMMALEQYANVVIQAGPDACNSNMISGHAWVRCAQSAKAMLQ